MEEGKEDKRGWKYKGERNGQEEEEFKVAKKKKNMRCDISHIENLLVICCMIQSFIRAIGREEFLVE